MVDSKSSSAANVVVLGSVNMDLVARCISLPTPGETVSGSDFAEIPGGKGANQAVAARRAGAQVHLVGRLGVDAFASKLRQSLGEENVDCSLLAETAEVSSGLAMIAVEDSGENQIVVVPGANGCVSRKDVLAAKDRIAQADVLLLQVEVPAKTVAFAIAVAKEVGTRVILDPAPAPNSPDAALFDVDLLCPNLAEAIALTGMQVEADAQIEQLAVQLAKMGAAAVAITLGAKGTALYHAGEFSLVEPFLTKAIDTTAAGDAFAGALAVKWAETGNLHEAVRFGNAAGALAAARIGAQPGMPSRLDIDEKIRTSD